jgi:hypothetical protein
MFLYSVQTGSGVLSLGVKRADRETDHPPPFSAEAKSGETISPLSHTPSWRGA